MQLQTHVLLCVCMAGPGGDAPATRAQRDQQSSSDPSAWSRLEAWLKGLGATVVIPDEGSVRVRVESVCVCERENVWVMCVFQSVLVCL